MTLRYRFTQDLHGCYGIQAAGLCQLGRVARTSRKRLASFDPHKKGYPMATKFLIILGILCIALCLCLVLCSDTAHAQGKGLANKESGELGNKEFDKDKLPNKLEAGLGIGSIFVMIAVVKYL